MIALNREEAHLQDLALPVSRDTRVLVGPVRRSSVASRHVGDLVMLRKER